MNRQRVYRAGLLTPAVDAGAARTVTVAADQRCPHPVGRTGALFAAPALDGVVRWVLGNHYCRFNTRVREITVDADSTWVYRVAEWERVREHDPATMDAYWATGMTLTRWLAADLDATEWEVLVAPTAVLGSRNVSAARLLQAAPEWRLPELRRIVRDWARAA